MTDAVQVFPPGFRVTDANDNPVNNAKIKFRDTGPGAPKTVYSDAALSVALGDTVRTRSDGQPVVSEGSSTTTLVYVGSDPYYIEITDENDAVIIPAKDNVKGAFTAAASTAVIPPVPVITTGSPLTLAATHQGKLINATSNTLTFTSAVTLGDGWWVKVRNNGASGQVILSAADGVSFEGQTFTLRALLPGEAMEIACDGTAFRVSSHTPPLMAAQGPSVIQIVGRVSSAPGGPTAGNRYLVSASYSTFSTHDIIEYNGTSYNKYTPPTDCGWIAFVQNENMFYAFVDSAWIPFFSLINVLTEDTTPDETADFLATYDTSASLPKKAKPLNFKRAGGFQLLNSGAVTNAATLDIVLTGFIGYRALKLMLSSFVPATDAADLWLRMSTDGGSTYLTTNYRYAATGVRDGSGTATPVSSSAAQILIASYDATRGPSNVASEGGIDSEITLHNQAVSRWGRVRFHSGWTGANQETVIITGQGTQATQNDVDALRIMFASGNITSGDWALYGMT